MRNLDLAPLWRSTVGFDRPLDFGPHIARILRLMFRGFRMAMCLAGRMLSAVISRRSAFRPPVHARQPGPALVRFLPGDRFPSGKL